MSEPIKDYIRKTKAPKKSITEHVNTYKRKRNICITSLPPSSRFKDFPDTVHTSYESESNDYQPKGYIYHSNDSDDDDAFGWAGLPEY